MLLLDELGCTLGSTDFRYTMSVESSATHAILGRSGSGKSTLLNLVAGFLTATHGNLSWQGESLLNVAAEHRPVATLFQQHNLFAHLTAWQNIGLGLHPGLSLTAGQRREMEQMLEHVGLTKHAHKRPAELSGGEQQRVALARCLLRKRPILLLDEPYSALDEATREEMLQLTRRVVSEHRLCVLLVTHSGSDAQALGATTWTLDAGRLMRASPPTPTTAD